MATDIQSAPRSLRALGALTICSFRDGDSHVVALAGELDLDTAAGVVRELAAAELTDPPQIAVDLRELTFIDSIGVSLLFNAHHRAARGGYRLIVVKGPQAIQRICGFCELAHPLSPSDMLTFVDTLPSEAASSKRARRRCASVTRETSQIQPEHLSQTFSSRDTEPGR